MGLPVPCSWLVLFVALLTAADGWLLHYKVWPSYQCSTAGGTFDTEGYWPSGSCVALTSPANCTYYVRPTCDSSSSFKVMNCTTSSCSSCNLALATTTTCTALCTGGATASGFQTLGCVSESPSPSPGKGNGAVGPSAPWGTLLVCAGLSLACLRLLA